MSTEKHTPGPWVWVESDMAGHSLQGKYGIEVIDDGSADGEYRPSIDVRGPDARLIAAAPELLECLQEIIDHELEEDCATCEWQTLIAAVKRAREVIAKATGATHAP